MEMELREVIAVRLVFYVFKARNHIPTHTTTVPQMDSVRDVVFKFYVF